MASSQSNSRLENLLAQSKNSEMKRTLGPWGLTFLGVGAIIGTGIFVLTGTAAANHAGPALVLSFVLAAIACAFAGLCYAEFASMIPVAGSAYTYAYATMGRLVAWIIGWDLILEYLLGAATVAAGWSGYFTTFLHNLGIHIPKFLSEPTLTPLIQLPKDGWVILTDAVKSTNPNWAALPQDTAWFNLPAMSAIMAVTVLLVVGIKESARFNNIAVVLKVAVVLAFIGFGWAFINVENWQPFIPENTGTFGVFGWTGILAASGVIFFAYIGFDAVSTVAQETINPQRNLPIGILASLIICTLLYILVTLVLTGIVPFTELNVKEPIALGVERAGGLNWLAPLINIGAIAGLSSVMLVMLMAQPRIFYSMSKEGLLPPSFSKIHPKFKTPYIPTIVTGIFCASAAGIFNVNDLGHMVSIGTLFAFIIVCVGIIILRKTHPNLPRPFRTPLVPLIPILGAVVCLALMIGLGWVTWVRLIAWMGLGLAIYYFYGRKRKPLPINKDEPEIPLH
jgi:APA family basic amino acid/polyamine antiporter